METAEIALRYIEVLIWPMVATFLLVLYGDAILGLLERSKVKLSLYGVTIETTISDLETRLTASVRGSLTERQWALLKEIEKEGEVSVNEKGYEMSMEADLQWIRPIRNAGLLVTEPEDKYIEQAEKIKLTELGLLLMEAKKQSS